MWVLVLVADEYISASSKTGAVLKDRDKEYEAASRCFLEEIGGVENPSLVVGRAAPRQPLRINNRRVAYIRFTIVVLLLEQPTSRKAANGYR